MSKPSFPATAFVSRILILGFGLALFIEQIGARRLLGLDGADGARMMGPVHWVSLIAPAFYLFALWMGSDLLVRIDRGEKFGAAMVSGLRKMGGALMLGAFARIVVQPSLIFLIGNGFSEMRGGRFDLNVETVTVALVGLTLILLARQGEKMRSSLEQFV